MSKCLKGESEVLEPRTKYACGKCGARTDRKDHVCKPEKFSGLEAKKKKKK